MKYDNNVHKHLLEIANQLNLQPHLVNGVDMALCGDIEIHKIQVKEEQNIFFALGKWYWVWFEEKLTE